jgi:hypothetical protein
MKPSSTLLICVNYQAKSITSQIQLPAHAFLGTNEVKLSNFSYTVSGIVPQDVSVAAQNVSSSTVTLAPGSSVTIPFETKVGGSTSQGFYFLQLPLVCPPLPLAIGNSSDVNSTQFAGNGYNICPPNPPPFSGINPSVIDVEGGSAAYIVIK